MTVEHTERKLARVVLIDSLHPIEGADRIELAMVGGWQVVVQKGLYVVGSKAVYFEIDSLLPVERPCFASLANISSKLQFVIDGKQYARIKTMKLRKQLSQGFCVPATEVSVDHLPVDTDCTQALGVLKYESEGEKAQKNGTPGNGKQGTSAKGFPKFIPKTDQNRLQNIPIAFEQARDKGELFEKSFKLDGSSMTVYHNSDLGVASRNVGFRIVDEQIPFLNAVKNYFRGFGWKRVIKADKNHFIDAARDEGVLDALAQMFEYTGRNFAIQGELVGPSIQKNFEGVDKNEFFVYDVYDIDNQKILAAR